MAVTSLALIVTRSPVTDYRTSNLNVHVFGVFVLAIENVGMNTSPIYVYDNIEI